MQTDKRRLVLLYYAFQFTFTLLFWTPIFFEYQKRVGLTEPQIFSIQSIYYLAFCLFEIPTGYFADRFGYLRSMKWGALVLIGVNLIPAFFYSYEAWIFHWVGIAVARSFVSGASSAYLYEFLRAQKLEKEYKQIEGKARAFSLVGRVVCFAGVGYMMQKMLSAPYLLTALSAALSLYFAFKLPEIHDGRAMAVVKIRLRDGLQIIAKSPALLFLIFQGVVIFVLGRIVSVNLFQPILESKHMGIEAYGWVMALMTLFEALGSGKPEWVQKYMTDLTAVFVLSFLIAVSLVLIPFFGASGAVVLLCVFSILIGFSFPIQKQLMNDAIPDPHYRATLLSAESIVDRLVCSGVALVLERVALGGQGAASGGFNGFIVYSAAISMAAITVLWVGLRVSRRKGTLRLE